MKGGFWRTRSPMWSASSWVFGSFFTSTLVSMSPEDSIWTTRVLLCVTDMIR